MLIQSSLHSSVDFDLSFAASGRGKENILCDWMAGAETWQMCPKFDEDIQDPCKREVLMMQEEKIIDGLSTCPKSSQPSVSPVSEISAPNLVYRRRKLRNKPLTKFSSQASPNTKGMEEPLISSIEKMTTLDLCNINYFTLNPEQRNVCSVGKEHHESGVAPKNGTQKTTELSSANDSCSSSKSNIELALASKKLEMHDNAECSSSDALIEAMGEDISETNFCISILKKNGLFGVWHMGTPLSQSTKDGTDNVNCSYRSCKVCNHSESILSMLICDNCEEAYHMACCNPRVKKIGLDEWFCQSCSKKTRKLLKGATSKSLPFIKSDIGRSSGNSTSEGDLGPIAFMLNETEAYTTSVRIGPDFQAEVPDWSGPITRSCSDDIIDEPLEVNPSELIHVLEWKCNKDSRLNSIGNWLQCQDVTDGAGEGSEGTICGKWRRAPLCEVQTDKWDCFRSVLWDPTHSDCFVPQELETDQVLKQLKYIEMLRPRHSAKRQRLNGTVSKGSQHSKENMKNIQTS